MEDSVFAVWHLRLRQHLAGVAPAVLGVNAILGFLGFVFDWHERSEVSRLKDLQAIYRWPDSVTNAAPRGRETLVIAKTRERVIGVFRLAFLPNPTALAEGKVSFRISDVLERAGQRPIQHAHICFSAIAGVFDEALLGVPPGTAVLSWSKSNQGWQYQEGHKSPGLWRLFFPETDSECAGEIQRCLAAATKNLLLREEVSETTGLSLEQLLFWQPERMETDVRCRTALFPPAEIPRIFQRSRSINDIEGDKRIMWPFLKTTRRSAVRGREFNT